MSTTLPRVNAIGLEHALSFLDEIFPEPRAFSIDLWGQAFLPATSGERFKLILNYPGALKKMFSMPLELNLGEAHIHGGFDVQGDFYAIFDLLDEMSGRFSKTGQVLQLLAKYRHLPFEQGNELEGRGPIHLSGDVHSKERDAQAVRYHYNVGNDFYSIWLDRNMQYSCGYFPTGKEDLDTAQELKMEHICRKLRLQPGDRLLDIGCGWGYLVMYAAEKFGVQAVGVTLSERQAEWGRQKILERGLSDRVRIETQDYRDLKSASFNKVSSVGMFEHVGRNHLPEYFTHVHRLLEPGGLLLNHGISQRYARPVLKGDEQLRKNALPEARESFVKRYLEQRVMGLGKFSQSYIFPDGELVTVSDANLIAEAAGFELRDVENLREHYALTIRNWVKNLEANKPAILGVTDEVTYRTWVLYLSSSVHGFESGSISVNQSLLSKPIHGKTLLPYSRADLYQEP